MEKLKEEFESAEYAEMDRCNFFDDADCDRFLDKYWDREYEGSFPAHAYKIRAGNDYAKTLSFEPENLFETLNSNLSDPRKQEDALIYIKRQIEQGDTRFVDMIIHRIFYDCTEGAPSEMRYPINKCSEREIEILAEVNPYLAELVIVFIIKVPVASPILNKEDLFILLCRFGSIKSLNLIWGDDYFDKISARNNTFFSSFGVLCLKHLGEEMNNYFSEMMEAYDDPESSWNLEQNLSHNYHLPRILYLLEYAREGKYEASIPFVKRVFNVAKGFVSEGTLSQQSDLYLESLLSMLSFGLLEEDEVFTFLENNYFEFDAWQQRKILKELECTTIDREELECFFINGFEWDEVSVFDEINFSEGERSLFRLKNTLRGLEIFGNQKAFDVIYNFWTRLEKTSNNSSRSYKTRLAIIEILHGLIPRTEPMKNKEKIKELLNIKRANNDFSLAGNASIDFVSSTPDTMVDNSQKWKANEYRMKHVLTEWQLGVGSSELLLIPYFFIHNAPYGSPEMEDVFIDNLFVDYELTDDHEPSGFRKYRSFMRGDMDNYFEEVCAKCENPFTRDVVRENWYNKMRFKAERRFLLLLEKQEAHTQVNTLLHYEERMRSVPDQSKFFAKELKKLGLL